MRLNANQLAGHLKNSLAPVYLFAGDEPLLVGECCAAVRAAAVARGYAERQTLTVEPGFDWNSFRQSLSSLSLFSEKRVVELRLPASKPGDTGAQMLLQVAAQPPTDTLLLVSAGRLDKRTQASRWVRALEAAGVMVIVYPLEASALPGWIARRMRSKGLVPEAGVTEMLAYHYEGNLLGAAQEVDKLVMLRGEGAVTVDDIAENLSDNARFSVFALVDTCLRGDLAGATRILHSLRSEGTEPILVLRVLAREARTVAQVSRQLQGGAREAQVFESFKIWPRRRSLVSQAAQRTGSTWWNQVLRRAANAERVLKGRLPGDVWQQLQCLAVALCGRRAATCDMMEATGQLRLPQTRV